MSDADRIVLAVFIARQLISAYEDLAASYERIAVAAGAPDAEDFGTSTVALTNACRLSLIQCEETA